jgi:hypothetical protein
MNEALKKEAETKVTEKLIYNKFLNKYFRNHSVLCLYY